MLAATARPVGPHGGRPLLPRAPRPRPAAPRAAAAGAPAAPPPARDAGASGDADAFTQSDWDSFVSGFTSQHAEHAQWLATAAVLEGAIPPELSGTLLRNGPGLYEIGGRRIPQPFDGDGMVAALSFPGGGRPPFVANRFVRTADFLAEQAAGRMLFRGAFAVGNPSGTGFFNPFDLTVKRVANTGVLRWGGRTMALYERDLPYELTGPDLRTAGRTDAGGAIDGPFFGAHYRVEARPDGSRRLIGFHSEEAGLDNRLTVWEFDEAGRRVASTRLALADAAFGFFHDFLATERYYLLLENPVRLDLWKFATEYVWGRACIAECLKFTPSRRTRVHVVPRPGAGAPTDKTRVFETPTPFFAFHHANAFEAGGGGEIVADTVAMLGGMDFGAANLGAGASYFSGASGRGTLTRLVIDTATGEVRQTPLMARACEFPCVAPAAVGRPHTHMYMGAARVPGPERWGALQCVAKVSVPPEGGEAQQRLFYPGEGRWAGEPIFVPRPGAAAEDDGWVLTVVFDAAVRRSELVVLRAQDMGVAARLALPFFLPSGLHGSWTPEYLGPPADQPYEPKRYDIRSGADKYE